jgi:hypothetical protein
MARRGIPAKVVTNATVVNLLMVDGLGVYQLPPRIKRAHLRIQVAEYGGWKQETQVICSPGGHPMRPFYIPRRGNLAGGKFHALFSCVEFVGLELKGSNVLKLTSVAIEVDGKTARIVPSTLWEGNVDAFPDELWKFRDAADAALTKAACRDCTHVHYAAMPPTEPQPQRKK